MVAAHDTNGLTARKLAAFATLDEFPEQALNVLRLSVLDWCAVGFSGRDEPVSRILRAQVLEEGGAGQGGLIGSRVSVPARAAALVNGATSHALDYDDTHFAHIGHPSVVVIPAALAVAQLTLSSGRAMQEAALIGAEASIRMGLWLGRAHYQTGFHQTATAGAFGACLTACRLLALDPEETQMALGLVSTCASGLKSQFGTMGKPMNAGIAAANGVEAALLAKRGFVSRAEALDGAQGFGPTHHGEAQGMAWEGMGETWLFQKISHKFHACCHGLHAMLEALTPVIGTDSAEIAHIEIRTHPRWLSVCNIARPETGLEAKFSYRMTAAMRLLEHDTRLPASYDDALCSDPEIIDLRDKVTVTADDGLSEMQTAIALHKVGGAPTTLFHDLAAPVSLSDRQAKVRAKAVALLGSDRAETLWGCIRDCAPPGEIVALLAE